jgi:hypothetical protein
MRKLAETTELDSAVDAFLAQPAFVEHEEMEKEHVNIDDVLHEQQIEIAIMDAKATGREFR